MSKTKRQLNLIALWCFHSCSIIDFEIETNPPQDTAARSANLSVVCYQANYILKDNASSF